MIVLQFIKLSLANVMRLSLGAWWPEGRSSSSVSQFLPSCSWSACQMAVNRKDGYWGDLSPWWFLELCISNVSQIVMYLHEHMVYIYVFIYLFIHILVFIFSTNRDNDVPPVEHRWWLWDAVWCEPSGSFPAYQLTSGLVEEINNQPCCECFQPGPWDRWGSPNYFMC